MKMRIKYRYFKGNFWLFISWIALAQRLLFVRDNSTGCGFLPRMKKSAIFEISMGPIRILGRNKKSAEFRKNI